MTLNFDGSELRNRRIEIESSLDDVSTECAIPVHLIEALEAGNLDALPGESYAIGFLQSYCRHLGLQSEAYIGVLREAFEDLPGDPNTEAKVPIKRMPGFELPRIPVGLSREVKAWLTVCAVLVVGWLTYSVIIQPDRDSQKNQAQAASIDSRLSPSNDSQ